MATIPGVNARFQKFGASATGDTSEFVLIGPTRVATLPDQAANGGNWVRLSTFKVTVRKGGSDSLFRLMVADDDGSGVAGTYSEVARIEMPDAGIMSDPDLGIYIKAGQWYKVTCIQATAARASASLLGGCHIEDQVDI
jgi:hypothetical protein